MKLLAKLLAIFAGIAVALYALYVFAFPTATIRYRLTLEAEVDGQPAIASGVIQVTRQDTTVIGAMGGYGASVKGEAVALDLGGKGTLFALVRGNDSRVAEDKSYPAYVFFYAFQDRLDKRADGLEQMRALQKQHPKTELPKSLMPMLVRFRDINDPKSIEQVDPENLAASFGPGVKLQRVIMEITDDAVTSGIERKLPWWAQFEAHGASLDGSRIHISNELANVLGLLSFKRRGQ